MWYSIIGFCEVHMASFQEIACQNFNSFYDLSESRVYWNGKKAIFGKLDWLSLIYNNATVNNVLLCLGLEKFYDVPDLYNSLSARNINILAFATYVNITICNVTFSVSVVEARYKLYELVDNTVPSVDKFLNTEWDQLRVDISGSGLDYLRSLGIMVDLPEWRSNDRLSGLSVIGRELQYHATRIDIAFDVLEFSSSLWREFADSVRFHLDTLGRVPVGLQERKKYVVAEVREGATRSIYMGRGTSDKLLRIYDKLYQLKDKPEKILYKDNDGHRPSTWIRYELQARREIECTKLLFCIDWAAAWHYIYSNFCVLRSDGRGGREVMPCWVDLFESVETKTIIQNANLAKRYIPSTEDKAYNLIIKNIRSITEFEAFYGRGNLTGLVDKYLHNLQTTCEVDDIKKWARILSELKYSSSNCQPEYLYYDPLRREYIIVENGEADKKFFDLFNFEGEIKHENKS